MSGEQAFQSDLELPSRNPVRLLTWGYILALMIIGIMSVAIHVSIDRIVAEQDGVATIIGKTAEQINRVQVVALRASKFVYQKDAASRDEFEQSIKDMRELHLKLVKQGFDGGNTDSTTARVLIEIYFDQPYELHNKITRFTEQANRLSKKPFAQVSAKDADYLAMMKLIDGAMGKGLNTALYSYQDAIVAKINTLQLFQRGAILVIILTLLCEAFLIFMPLVRRVTNYANELKKITMTDVLTGVGNRRYFIFRGTQEIQRCRRLKKDLCLAIIDLDFFKMVNDNYGHKSGDLVLQQFVEIAQKTIRLEDVIARIGGEEFAVLLPHTAIEDAVRVIERMRKSVEEKEFIMDRGFKGRVTMSAGLTKVNLARDDFETSLVLADVALYDAKRTGRNKVVFKEVENFFEEDAAAADGVQNVVPLKKD